MRAARWRNTFAEHECKDTTFYLFCKENKAKKCFFFKKNNFFVKKAHFLCVFP